MINFQLFHDLLCRSSLVFILHYFSDLSSNSFRNLIHVLRLSRRLQLVLQDFFEVALGGMELIF
jgi:hypothetical protein